MYLASIGQDSHRFTVPPRGELVLGGCRFSDCEALEGNSDADVILHALCNAISNVIGEPILGAKADDLCAAGETDSRAYVRYALQRLGAEGWRLCHVAFSLEASRPKLLPKFPAMRAAVAELCGLPLAHVCMTATSGEGLTDFGKGLGMACFCSISTYRSGDPLEEV